MGFWQRMGLMLAVGAMPLLARAEDTAATSGQAPPAAGATATPAPIEPQRLAAARRIVDAVFPAGTYARIMGQSMDSVMSPMLDDMTALPIADIARMGGAKPEDVAKLGKSTIAQIMAILDPAYRERLQIATRVMASEMSAAMTEVEPGMRDGLSRAYARRFDLAQLGELDRFFATPTGHAYAAQSLTIMTDPDVIAQVKAFLPMLMKRLPAIGAKIEAATGALPKQRSYDDLTPAEKARLDRLVGDEGKVAPAPAG